MKATPKKPAPPAAASSAPPTVRYEMRPLRTLTPDPRNPRSITDEAAGKLHASIRRFGIVQPIVVNETTGHVVGGHQRLAALRKLDPEAETMVVIGSWTEAEERALNVTLNNRALQGEFTDEAGDYLDEVLGGLSLRDFRALDLESVMPAPPRAKRERKQGEDLTYKVVVSCSDERHQAALMNRLEAEGLTCSPLIS
jgi:hypothetical protein